jgi:hypothetical protein
MTASTPLTSTDPCAAKKQRYAAPMVTVVSSSGLQLREEQHRRDAEDDAHGGPAQAELEGVADVLSHGAIRPGQDQVAELVDHDGGPVVEDGLRLDKDPKVGQATELFQQGDDSDGVGGGKDSAEEERLQPPPAVRKYVFGYATDERRLDDYAWSGEDHAAEKMLGKFIHVGVSRPFIYKRR